MALNGSNDVELVAKNDLVDIDNVTRIGRGQKVIGYTYAEEDRHAAYFDPEFGGLTAKLGRALPNQPLIDFVDASEDGNSLLVFAGSDVLPGTYYFLDRTTKEMSPIADVRPKLVDRTLSPVKSIRYKARDGASIQAYLTIPASSSGKNLPAVVLPHGGPSARDEWGFDWLPQFLAARGYAVIQPNYRGSEGFGDQYKNVNAFKNWETAIGDVNDAVRHLVTEGIADKNRLAIVGWSYGGYAALQSAAVDPTLYKAIVAIAPVTDLALLKSESEGYTNSNLVKEFVGSGDHVRRGSPLRNASALKAPVLLVHGDLDINVGVQHSLQMESALKSSGSPVELLRYPELDHQLVDSNARVEMLTKIGELLGRTIGN
nr:alpha/beta fold hydrolase [Sphingomonas brevis]